MNITLSEKEIIYILNALRLNTRFLTYHSQYEKSELEFYYNFENYDEYILDLDVIFKRIGLSANEYYYNLKDEIFFEGQRKFILSKEKNFDFLFTKFRNRKVIKRNEKERQNKIIKLKEKILDKFKVVV